MSYYDMRSGSLHEMTRVMVDVADTAIFGM